MKVKPLASVEVVPVLPDRIGKLKAVAYNLLWSWNPDIQAMFRVIDGAVWDAVGHNPARLLRAASQRKLDEAAASESFLEHYDRCVSYLEHYLKEPTWFDRVCERQEGKCVVYLSMEYGLTETLPIYSGGLGVLSGDHLKSASDLGLPLIGVGLLYRQGYFQQLLSADGYQHEAYPENDFDLLPITPVLNKDGSRLRVELEFPGRTVHITAWKAQVGRVPLYLLDTDLPENSHTDRRITYMLYGGDRETRIQQEIVLGMGGAELIYKLGITPAVCHMNEGHSAFIQLARVAHARRDHKLMPWEAVRFVSAGTVFTTHTPVPAGIDQFPPELMDRYFGHQFERIGLRRDELYSIGAKNEGVAGQAFNMAIFAMRTSGDTNGVSRLHGDVSRTLWEESWPNLPHDEIPIDYVTNGIHLRTWISESMALLFDRYLGTEWRRYPDNKEFWSKVRDIPDEELWNAHVIGRQQLVGFVRRRAAELRVRTTGVELSAAELDAILDPHALTIGFARRFATYKRATLLLRYPDRLLALLRNRERPLQIVFAGKAHPQDEAGKSLIHDIIYFARANGVSNRLLFIENYDMAVARYLVQGVDIWLNTPRRPLEASGTSGMKVLGNGGLNASILDGWWDEAYAPGLGWAISRGKTVADEAAQDELDAGSLYDMLENQIVPLFYTRDDSRLPRRWIAWMKDSITQLVPRFNSTRMVKEYCQDYYAPAMDRSLRMMADNFTATREVAAWKDRVREHWREIKVTRIVADAPASIVSGSHIDISADVQLGPLTPGDVEVQAYYGPLRADGTVAFSGFVPLELVQSGNGLLFKGRIAFPESGRYGFTVRVMPYHPLLGNNLKMGLVHWATVPITGSAAT